MFVNFATCERWKALEYIQRVYPNSVITDTEESAKDLLDFVEKDIVRIQDPLMYGMRIGVTPGTNWKSEYEAGVIKAASKLTP